MHRKSRKSYPDGIIGIYDNGGKTFDRYTVVYTPFEVNGKLCYIYRGMSHNPSHPQGFGQCGESKFRLTSYECGKTINFEDLPIECRTLVNLDIASSKAA